MLRKSAFICALSFLLRQKSLSGSIYLRLSFGANSRRKLLPCQLIGVVSASASSSTANRFCCCCWSSSSNGSHPPSFDCAKILSTASTMDESFQPTLAQEHCHHKFLDRMAGFPTVHKNHRDDRAPELLLLPICTSSGSQIVNGLWWGGRHSIQANGLRGHWRSEIELENGHLPHCGLFRLFPQWIIVPVSVMLCPFLHQVNSGTELHYELDPIRKAAATGKSNTLLQL